VGRIARKSCIPCLEHVKLTATLGEPGTVRFSATDLETTLHTELGAEVQEPGTVVVNARDLAKIVKGFGKVKPVTVRSLDSDRAEVSSNGAVSTLPTYPAEDMPMSALEHGLPELQGSATQIPAAALLRAIGHVDYAVTDEDARYYLAGAQLAVAGGTLHLTATNGHVLADYQEQGIRGDIAPMILPRDLVANVKRYLAKTQDTPTFSQHNQDGVGYLGFRVGQREIISKVIEGKFPDADKVLDTPPTTTALVDRVSLLEAGRQAAGASDLNCVKLTFIADQVGVAGGDGSGSHFGQNLPAVWSGSDRVVGLNGTYLRQTLESLAPADSVRVAIPEAETRAPYVGHVVDSIHFTPEPAGPGMVRCIVMPMRLG